VVNHDPLVKIMNANTPTGFAPAAVIMPGLELTRSYFPHLEDSGEPRHCSEDIRT
jgi:hypothetical protein